MEALPTNGCIRFFGDNNQLPPVESDGESESPFLKVLNRPDGNVTLTHNYRSDDFIVSNALRILEGRVPIQNERFRIIYDDNPIKRLIHFATKDFMDMDHQIIMPTRRGKYGTIRVNPSLQVKWNGRGPCLLLERHDDGGKEPQADLAVRGQDKFLWTKNDYQLNLFNGEIGQIEWSMTKMDQSACLHLIDRWLCLHLLEPTPHITDMQFLTIRGKASSWGTLLLHTSHRGVSLRQSYTVSQADSRGFLTVKTSTLRLQEQSIWSY